MMRMPASWHLATASGDRGSGRIEHRHHSQQAQVPLGLLATLGQRRLGVQAAARDPEHTQALAGVARDHALDLRSLLRPEATRPTVWPHARRTERQQRLGRPLGVHPQRSLALLHRRHQLDDRVEVKLPAAAPLALYDAHVRAELRGGHQHRDLGGVPGGPVGLRVVAGRHRGRQGGQRPGGSIGAGDRSRAFPVPELDRLRQRSRRR